MYRNGKRVGFIPIDDPKSGRALIDEDVVDSFMYEYRIITYGRSGIKRICPVRVREQYVKPRGLVVASVRSMRPPNKKDGFQFVLSLQKSGSTLLDEVIDGMNLEKFELFKESLSEIKEATASLVKANIRITHVGSGESVDLGEYSNGQFIEFKPRAFGAYIVQVSPYIVSPSTVINSLKTMLNNVGDSINLDGPAGEHNLGPSTAAILSTYKRQLNIFSKRNSKFTSKIAMARGIISSEQSDAKNYANKLQFENLTGDFVNVVVNFNIDTTRMVCKKSTIRRTHDNRALVNFVLGNEVRISEIDYYVITAKKEGAYYPVCSLHCEPGHKIINFIDFTNRDYIGTVEYFIQGMTEYGESTNMCSIGKVNFLESVALDSI